jgi:phosphatidylglycerol---prolipoprotein diacylglyceryl transferase
MNAIIDFNQLGLHPELFRIGGFALRWYSLAYLFGFLLGWAYLKRMLARPGAPMQVDDADDFLVWMALGIMIGGRVGYLLFYAPAGTLDNPLNAFAVWNGGMAFHGGFAGVVIALAGFAWVKGVSWLRIADYMACVYPIGHIFGRAANFINGELWGRPTDGSWGIIFPLAGPEPRHPSQLYQLGIEGLLPFLILGWLFWRTDIRLKPGYLSGGFLLLMGVGRYVCEIFREPDRHLGVLSMGLTMGQLLTVVMFGVGVVLVFIARKLPSAPEGRSTI